MDYQIVETNQLVVTQANSLVYAAYEMTLQEKRLLLLLISMIRKEHDQFHTYYIPTKQIAEFLGIHNKTIYQVVKKVCSKLMSRVIHIQKPNGDWDELHWVATAKYRSRNTSKTGEAELQLRIHDELRPMLLELKKQFASIPFEHIANISSYHSVRIFEILYHTRQRLQKSQVRIPLEELKQSLGIADKYPNFANFRDKVLKPAQKNLTEKTLITFSYKTIKQGNKVIALDFDIKDNSYTNQLQLELDLDAPRTLRFLQLESEEKIDRQKADLIKKLQATGYTGNCNQLVETIGIQAVEDVIELALEQQEQGRKTGNQINNLGGLINILIQNEAWKVASAKRQLEEEVRKQTQEYKNQTNRNRQIESIAENITKEHDKAYQEYFFNYWKNLNEEQKALAIKDMKENSSEHILHTLNNRNWKEDSLFFLLALKEYLERTNTSYLPEHLYNKVAYFNYKTEQKQINIDESIIDDLIERLSSK